MIYFGIPLKSKPSSNDWDIVTKLFNRALKSLYNQTNPNFKIIIACHEIPDLTMRYDERVEFIQVNTQYPINLRDQMIDKGYKVHAIAKKVREYGGGYLMLCDADDLYSCRLSEFVESNSGCSGWVIKTGYEYLYELDVLKLSLKHPPQPIVYYRPEDLPKDMDGADSDSNINQAYIVRKGHGNIERTCLSLGRKLNKLPFRAHVYVKYSGENHSIMNGKDTILRRLSRFFMPSYDPRNNEKIRNEFSIDWIQ